jgi:hypothetical protein
VRLAMLEHATAPFWMEFRGVGSRVSGRVGDGLGMRRRCRQRRRRVARWSAVGTGGEGGRELRQAQEAHGCARLGKRAAVAGSGGARLRCWASERLRPGQEAQGCGVGQASGRGWVRRRKAAVLGKRAAAAG